MTKLAEAVHNQSFIARTPVAIVCCADISSYIERTASGAQDLGKTGVLKGGIVNVLCNITEGLKEMSIEEISPQIAANVAIAIEYMVLRVFKN